MRKIAILLIVLFVAAGVSGCKSDEQKRREAAQETANQLLGPRKEEPKKVPSYTDPSWFKEKK